MSIKLKKRVCTTCKELNYIFSKGRCKTCAQISYADKAAKVRGSKARARTPKIPSKKHRALKAKELETMQAVWRENEDIDERCLCSECGTSLQFDRTHCAHILSKGAFPQHRDNPENIVILCLPCHTMLDCGIKTQMTIWPYIEETIFKLKGV